MSRALIGLGLGLLVGLAATAPLGAATFTVTKIADSDDGVCDADCSLREAINAANANSEDDHIDFAIPGAGVHTISPTSELPPFAPGHAIFIDGGGSCGWPSTMPTELDGHLAGTAEGLRLLGDQDYVYGLVINRFATGDGIEIQGDADFVFCSFVGTDSTGTQALPNFNGIRVGGSNAFVGGPRFPLGSGSPNLISGNTEAGIRVDANGSVAVDFNWIGTNGVEQTGALGNGGAGVYFADGSSGSSVRHNTIAHNGAGAVWVYGDTTHGISVWNNSTFDNGGIAIDLVGSLAQVGPTPNDPGDADEGPNRLQNYPALEGATVGADAVHGGFALRVRYRVDSDPANAAYPIDVVFYRREALGDGGDAYVGAALYSESQFAPGMPVTAELQGSVPPASVGDVIIATATDADGNTSEFTPGGVTVDEAPATAAGLAVLGVLALYGRSRMARH